MKRSNFSNVILAALGSFVPVVATLAILIVLGFNPGQFHTNYSDEVHYWNETNILSVAGFNGGYSVINEVAAKAGTSFGPHGPAFPMVQYLYASILGWSPLSPFIFNCLSVSVATFIFLLVTKPTYSQRILAVLFLITFFPLILFLPTGMQESFHQGVAILLASYVVYSGRAQKTDLNTAPLSAIHSGLLLAAFCLVSFVRPSWILIYAFCMVPVIERSRKPLLKVILVIVAIITSYGFMHLFFAPTQNQGQLTLMQLALAGDIGQIKTLLGVASRNASGFLIWETREAFPASLLHYEMLVVIVSCTYAYILNGNKLPTADKVLVLSAWLILFVSIVAVIFLYEVGSWRDYRILAPSFLTACLILLFVRKCTWLIWLVLLFQVVSFAKCLDSFDLYRGNNFSGLPDITKRELLLKNVIVFNSRRSAWCNTLLINTPGNDDSILVALSLAPGIGVSVVHKFDTLKKPIKSQWVLLNEVGKEQFRQVRFLDRLKKVIFLNGVGEIFQNLDAECG